MIAKAQTPLAKGIGVSKVLVATDLSLDGDRAVRRGALLPLQPSAHLLMMYVLPSDIPFAEESLLRGAAENELERSRQKLLAGLARRDRKDVTVAAKVVKGPPADEIARMAEVIDADLVCVGRRGLSRMRRVLLGSIARRVVRRSTRPVLVVSRPATRAYRHAVVGHDLTPLGARAARMARRLVPLTGRLTAVHGYQDPLENIPPGLIDDEPATRRLETAKILGDRRGKLQLALEPLTLADKEWRDVIEQGDPRTLILGVARSGKADLVAVGSAGRKGMDRMMIGSVAEAVLERSPCDTLVVRTSENGAGSR